MERPLEASARLAVRADAPPPEATWRVALRYAADGGVPRRSAKIALVVGTVLNLINQGDVLLAGGSLDWLKCLLTYVVPYMVSTCGAVAFRMNMAGKGDGA